MSYQTLTCHKKDHLVIINLIGPVNDQLKMARLSGELSDLCAEITLDDEIWVIILSGTGEKPFSIGMELIEAVSNFTEEPRIKFCSFADPIAKLDRPVIAAINGDAIGQALELALACDIRIASENSRFGLPHVKTGLIPWDGGTQRLLRLVGVGNAMQMILCGEIINAHEAYRIGLVNKVVSPEEIKAVAMEVAQEMVSKAPIALRYAKEAIYKGMDLTLEQGLRLEADLYFILHTTGDRTKGIKAFREKRDPGFEGR